MRLNEFINRLIDFHADYGDMPVIFRDDNKIMTAFFLVSDVKLTHDETGSRQLEVIMEEEV